MKTSSAIPLSLLLTAACATPRSPVVEPSLPDADVRLLQDHYAGAERELLGREVSGLTPEQRATRARLLEEFRAYRERGEFGRALAFSGARVPAFVDAGGR
ncbi:MAG: hypothetical protein ACREIU_08380, partial [Planctomycetota bacterium]